jgi:DNA invertase Pin-like site-specific DNA recombinase
MPGTLGYARVSTGDQDVAGQTMRSIPACLVRLDRLGRALGELLAIVTMLKDRGIALLSLEEKIDTSSAAGELVFHVFGAIAHFERRLIAERTKDGIAAAAPRENGQAASLDADRIAAALKLVSAGLSPTAAARQLGLGRSTVYREVSRIGIQRGFVATGGRVERPSRAGRPREAQAADLHS